MTGPHDDAEVVDTPYARPGGLELLARIYRPRGDAATPRAAVVYVHGGAWARSDRTADAILCHALAASGRVVVALDFRQAPDHRFPAAVADVAAGVRYARAHARRLGLDPARIGLLGSSSGGHLALLHALRPAAPIAAGSPVVMPDGSLDAEPRDASVAFVVALYPVASSPKKARCEATSRLASKPEGGGGSSSRESA
jgi:acetyl esterase/lipase